MSIYNKIQFTNSSGVTFERAGGKSYFNIISAEVGEQSDLRTVKKVIKVLSM
jgi:hypothetical protein